jgi:hypothetical protein
MSCLIFRHTKGLELCPRLFKVVVDDDLIKDTGSFCEFELILCLGETLSDGVLVVGSTPAQTLFQNLKGRWLQGEVTSVEVSLFDLLDTL